MRSYLAAFVTILFLLGFSELDGYVIVKLLQGSVLWEVINTYLPRVMMNPKTLEYRDGVLHINDLEGPKKEGDKKARLRDVEQELFKCQRMVEGWLDANHTMITELLHEQKWESTKTWEAIDRLHVKVEDLQAQIYDPHNQNYEYETKFKMMGLAANFKIPETTLSFLDGQHMTWKKDNKLVSSPPSSPKKETWVLPPFLFSPHIRFGQSQAL